MRLARLAVLCSLGLALGSGLPARSVLAQQPAPDASAVQAPSATPQPPQQTGLPPTLLPLLTTPEHRAALLRAAHAVDLPGAPRCDDENYSTTGQIGILVPLKLDADGKVVQGVWKESIRATGCGAPRLLNTMTEVKPDGTLETTPLLPGTTIADPRLQEDSVRYAAAAMGALPQGCNRGGIVDTKFVGVDGQPPGTKPTPGAPPKPWSELWTLQACAKRVDVLVHFAPDANGTAIRASLANS